MEYYTKTLPLDQSKHLLTAIQKPGKQAQWIVGCGDSGGVMTEVEYNNIFLDELVKIKLPSYCSSIDILAKKIVTAASLPTHLLMCGDEWSLWGGGGCRFVEIAYISKWMRLPVSIRFTHDNQGRYYGRDWNLVSEFSMSAGWYAGYAKYLPDFDSEKWKVEDAEVISRLEGYQAQYGLKSEDMSCLLGVKKYPGSIEYFLDPHYSYWKEYEQKMRAICADDAEGDVIVVANEGVGGFSTVSRGPRNILDEVKKVMGFAINSEYQKFDLDYYTVKPESWVAREKRQRKWKKPILQELGVLNYKDGGEVAVKIIIEKEGYVFVLNFEDYDSYMRFPDTLLFKKFEWISGHE